MTRALVLSGGGSVGIAWQTGLAAGLATKGIDLAQADFIVGTSAGSAVGARLALGRDMVEATAQYRKQALVASSTPQEGANAGVDMGAMAERMMVVMKIMGDAAASTGTFEERMAMIGTVALDADGVPEDQFVTRFSDLAGEKFPDGYACTAVDAHSGEFHVWNASSDVPVDHAVASSCAVPGMVSPITIDGHRYMDGGMRSVTNADLAAGYDTVLIITLAPPERVAANPDDARSARMLAQMEHERAVLLEGGAAVEVVGPDDEAAAAMGMNLMDPRSGPPAAEAGFRQGQAFADKLEGFWA